MPAPPREPARSEIPTTTPAPAERRARPRARRAALPKADTGMITSDAFAAQHGITLPTLRLWMREGLPFVRICGLVFFRAESAREWFASREERR